MGCTAADAGTAPVVSASRQPWHLERTAPVRADAEGMFVPVDELPEAQVGDSVTMSAAAGGVERAGTIAGTSEHDAVRFFRIELDP
jgi:hypothetical protein